MFPQRGRESLVSGAVTRRRARAQSNRIANKRDIEVTTACWSRSRNVASDRSVYNVRCSKNFMNLSKELLATE